MQGQAKVREKTDFYFSNSIGEHINDANFSKNILEIRQIQIPINKIIEKGW